MKDNIINYIFLATISLFSLTIHEFSHGYAAYKLGDTTAKDCGRLTLNPLKHIDPLGLVAMIVFKVGWAKPVPINSNMLRKKNKDVFIVALAGPCSNILLAIIMAYASKLFYGLQWYYPFKFCYLAVIMNVGFAVFNILPIPPLDGSRFLFLIKSEKFRYYLSKYERYSFILLYILLRVGLLDNVIYPVVNYIINIMV